PIHLQCLSALPQLRSAESGRFSQTHNEGPKMNNASHQIARRQFLRGTAVAAGMFSVGALPHARAAVEHPKFEYDIDRFRKVDPALVHYERQSGFAIPRSESKRIALGNNRVFVANGRAVFVLNERGALLNEISLTA